MSGGPSSPLTLLGPRVGATGSVTRLEIDEVTWQFAVLDAPDVLSDEIGLSLRIARSGSGRVRRDQHILHLPEGRIHWKRLRIGDVETSATEVPGLQRHDQRRSVDHLSAPNVIDGGARLHSGERGRIEQTARARCIWKSNNHMVCVRHRRVEIPDRKYLVESSRRGVGSPPEAVDAHPKCRGALRHGASDLADADDQHGLALEL